MTPHDSTEARRIADALGRDLDPLIADASEATLARQRARFVLAATSTPRRSIRRAALPLGVALAAAAGAVFFAVRRAPPEAITARVGDDAVRAGQWVDAGAAPLELRFGDGSRVSLSPHTQARIERLDARGAALLIERGSAQASVRHTATSSWRFSAGPYSVDVTGTAFSVAQGALLGPLRPRDARGARGAPRASLRGGHRRARPRRGPRRHGRARAHARPAASRRGGRRADAGRDGPDAAGADPVEAPAPERRREDAARRSPPRRGARRARARCGRRGRRGERDAPRGRRTPRRVAGHAGEGAPPSTSDIASGEPPRPRARPPCSACSRSRSFHAPAEAARWFELYLRESPDGSLAREALGRRVQSLHLAGDDAGAREAAERYLARDPDGPFSPFARGILRR
ncbi:MAG: FecR domain-containing protein [Polyangiales bacterium]